MLTDESPGRRIASLDQFRGYTVAGMLLVNFLGGFHAIPAILKHHNTYCSYADTIMPQFFFAVGFAYRLTYLRRAGKAGRGGAILAALHRNAGLILLGLVFYHLDGRYESWATLRDIGPTRAIAGAFRREPFQALVHIGVTALWVLPVIGARSSVRLLYLLGSAGLHLALSWQFYLDWAWKTPVIDGGPLGFLSWTIPLLAGSLAYDAAAAEKDPRRLATRLMTWAVAVMGAGYGLSCLGGGWAAPPFTPPATGGGVDLWTMSQRTGSISYLTFATGISLAVYALFVLLCDLGEFRSRLFGTFGVNALAAYLIHPMVAGAVKPFMPGDSPLWYVVAGFSLYFAICYGFNRYLEKHGLFLKL
jgi:predicted acyltransferase